MKNKNSNVRVIKTQKSNLGMFIFLFFIAIATILIPAGLAAYAEGVSQDLATDEAEILAVDSAIEEGIAPEDLTVINENGAVDDSVVNDEESISEPNPFEGYMIKLLLYDGLLEKSSNVYYGTDKPRLSKDGGEKVVLLDSKDPNLLTIGVVDGGSFEKLTCKSFFSMLNMKGLNFTYEFKIVFYGDNEEIGWVRIQRDCSFNNDSFKNYTVGSTGQIYSTSDPSFNTKTGFLYEEQPLTKYSYMAYKISCVNTYSLICNNEYVAQGAEKGTIDFIHNSQGYWWWDQQLKDSSETSLDSDKIYSFYGDSDYNNSHTSKDDKMLWIPTLLTKDGVDIGFKKKFDASQDQFTFKAVSPQSDAGLKTVFAGWTLYSNAKTDPIDQSAPGKRQTLLSNWSGVPTSQCIDFVANFVSAKEFKVNVNAQVDEVTTVPVKGANVTYTISGAQIDLRTAQMNGLVLQATTNDDGVATLVVPSEITDPDVTVVPPEDFNGYMTNIGTADPANDSVDVLLYQGRLCTITADVTEGHDYFEHVVYRDGHLVGEPEIVEKAVVSLDPDAEDKASLEVCRETEQWPDKYMNLHYHNEYLEADGKTKVTLDSFWKPVGQDYFKILYYTDQDGKEFSFMWIDPNRNNANELNDYEDINIEAHYQGSANVTFETDHLIYNCNYKIAGETALDYQITKTYTDLLYAGTKISADGGTLNLAYSGPAEIASVQDESGTVIAQPEQGYNFVKWTINGEDISNGITLEAAKDYTVKAVVAAQEVNPAAKTGDNTLNMLVTLMVLLISSAACSFIVRKRYNR